MPTYEYCCAYCGHTEDQRRPVAERDWSAECPECCFEELYRRFTPTELIVIFEHFRHNQADFLPDKEDKAGWENRATRADMSQWHAPPEDGLLKTLQAEFLEPEKVTLNAR